MDFDFDSIKLSPTFAAGTMVEKLITTIPIRKPNSDEFLRVRDDPEWTFSMYVLYLNDGEEEKYIVAKELISEVMDIGKLRPVMIHTLITHTTRYFSFQTSHSLIKMGKIMNITELEGKHMQLPRKNGLRLRLLSLWPLMKSLRQKVICLNLYGPKNQKQ